MKFFLLCFLMVTMSTAFANDTLYFRFSDPYNTLKDANGRFLRKAVQTDSGWQTLDFNENHILVCRGFYTDTNFTNKLHCHQHFTETKGSLEEIICYENGKPNGLNIVFNEQGDTLLRNRFVQGELTEHRQFPGYENLKRAVENVEVEAEFIAAGEWTSFLSRHLNANVPLRHKAPAGTYKVVVQFLVDKDSSVTQLKPLTNFGYGMEEEVMRVIRKSPKWRPATQAGRPVKAYRKQPITFYVAGK